MASSSARSLRREVSGVRYIAGRHHRSMARITKVQHGNKYPSSLSCDSNRLKDQVSKFLDTVRAVRARKRAESPNRAFDRYEWRGLNMTQILDFPRTLRVEPSSTQSKNADEKTYKRIGRRFNTPWRKAYRGK